MQLILSDTNQKLMGEWSRHFAKYKNILVKEINMENHDGVPVIEIDAFGFTGDESQEQIQTIIKNRAIRELLVGESLFINNRIYSVIYRVPTHVYDTSNVYVAFKSALHEAELNDVKRLLVNGLGMTKGEIEPADCARQMYRAYADYYDKYPKFPASLREAVLTNQELVGIINMKRRLR